MAEAMSTSQSCALCSQPATRACTACKADLDLLTTYYCSVNCQRTHWVEHKADCAVGAGRTALYRAASMARSIFLNFLKQAWGDKVLSAQKTDDVLSVTIGELSPDVIYCRFPSDLGLSKLDEAAVLSHCACSSSLAYMWDIVNLLLSGRASAQDLQASIGADLFPGENVDVKEVSARVFKCPSHTYFIWPSGCPLKSSSMRYVHQFWRVCDNKRAYFLDLASSQFGYHEALTPADDYTKDITIVISSVKSGGYEKTVFTQHPKIQNDVTRLVHAELSFAHSAAIVKAISDWQTSKNIKIRRLLRMSQRDFEQNSTELLDRSSDAVFISIVHFSKIASRIPAGTDVDFILNELLKEVRATKSLSQEQQRHNSMMSFMSQPEALDYLEEHYEEMEPEQKNIVKTYLQIVGPRTTPATTPTTRGCPSSDCGHSTWP